MGMDINFYKIDENNKRIDLGYFGISTLRKYCSTFVELLIEYAYNYMKREVKEVTNYEVVFCHCSYFGIIIFDLELSCMK